MKRKHKKKPDDQIKLAKQHIKDLFKQADELSKDELKLGDKYVKIARKIAMKFKIKLTIPQKRKFCKHCYAYFRPAVTCRIRLAKERKIYYCLKCKKYTRIPFKALKTKN